MPDNSITVIGSLGQDPELRYTATGRPVVGFSIAVNRRFQRNNEWEETTSWFRVSAWADLAENIAASVSKGTRVIVFGRLEQREYETKDGEKRTAVEIVADEVAPSLRWARATVERTERSGSGGGGQRAATPTHDEEPW